MLSMLRCAKARGLPCVQAARVGLVGIISAIGIMTGAGAALNFVLPTNAQAQAVSCPDTTTASPTYHFSTSSCSLSSGAGLVNSLAFDGDYWSASFSSSAGKSLAAVAPPSVPVRAA